MKPFRSMLPAASLLAALAFASPAARAQGFLYGQGVTGYSYTGFGSSYGSYGFGGVGPMYYGQGFTAGGVYGSPYGGVYGSPYGGLYGGGVPGFYGGAVPGFYGPSLPYSQPTYQDYNYAGPRGGAVGGVVPYIPRLDATLPQLSPRVPTLR